MATAAATDPLISLALATRTNIAAGRIRVPPYPAIAARLRAELADPDSTTRDIAQVIAADPVLVAMVLARSGSAGSGTAPATSLEIAIMRLGGQAIMQLALAAGLGGATAGNGPLASLRRGRWQDALVAAGLCELLADRRGLEGERAYLAGLLHDFGAIVVIASLEEELGKQAVAAPQPAEAWARIVERHHLDAAVHVAHAWKLPADLATVMAEHHDIGARAAERPLLRLVWDVDRAIAALTAGQPITGLAPVEVDEVTRALPKIVENIAAFETAMPSVASAIKAPSAVARPRSPTGGTAAKFEVSTPKMRYRGTALWADRFAFEGAQPLRPDWLTELTVADGTDRLHMLVHIRACEPCVRGYAMTAQPFGLGGDEQEAWARMIERAKR